MRLRAIRTKRSVRSAICASSILRSASPTLGIGSPSADRWIARRSPMACDEQGCRNDDTVPAGYEDLTYDDRTRCVGSERHVDALIRGGHLRCLTFPWSAQTAATMGVNSRWLHAGVEDKNRQEARRLARARILA